MEDFQKKRGIGYLWIFVGIGVLMKRNAAGNGKFDRLETISSDWLDGDWLSGIFQNMNVKPRCQASEPGTNSSWCAGWVDHWKRRKGRGRNGRKEGKKKKVTKEWKVGRRLHGPSSRTSVYMFDTG